MSPGRLTFSYPHLFKPFLVAEASSVGPPKQQCRRPPTAQAAYMSLKPSRIDSTFVKRHGKAVEPVVPMPPPEKEIARREEPPCSDKVRSSRSLKPAGKSSASSSLPGADDSARQKAPETPTNSKDATDFGDNSQGQSSESSGGGTEKKNHEDGPMETVLKEGESPKAQAEAKKQKKPALSPPPYIHSFDTYQMVRALEKGGFTEGQSIQAMKALRGLLSQNLDKARDVLVSKSDVENETYLFRAACSELSTEVKNNRKAADEHMRQQRTMLQHEVDILTQNLNQELTTLDDTVRNMFNERKMAVKQEESEIQGAIQQLHLQISAKLNSDAKSDIEGVRWVIMRLTAGGLGFVALLAIGMFNYVSKAKKARKEADIRKKKEEEERKRSVERGTLDHSQGPAAIEILAAN